MENNIIDRIKSFVSRYIIFIFLSLIVILIILLLLPNEEKEYSPKQSSILTLSLKGSSNISILKGEKYNDAGFVAYDTKDGDLTRNVIVEGFVDTSQIGKYTIKYKVRNSSGKISEAVRIVNVVADLSDVKYEINYEPKELTNGEVVITLKVSGDGYDFTLDPDGNIKKSPEVIYQASRNDEYLFSIKRKDGTVIEKEVKIENIDKKKPTGSCKGVVTLEKTSITVTANDESGIKNYSYTIDGKKYDSASSTYSVSGTHRNVVITVYDKASNYETINCIMVDNTWPIFEKQNYVVSSAKNYDQTRRYNKMNYIIYYPDNLNLNEKNPLVIFLHGGGEFGSNIKGSFNQNTAFVNNMRDGKFQQKAIFLAPQCNSENQSWKYDCFTNLKGLIDQVVTNYNVDPKRISIAGHSLGGQAVYDMLVAYPGFFAAAVPIAPSGGTKKYEKLSGVKIAVFTGTKDGLYRSSKSMAEYLESMGVNIKFYDIPGEGHAAQPPVFNETNIINWMIAQSR